MNDSQLMDALRQLDRPAQPDPAFAEALLGRLETQRPGGLARRGFSGRLAPLSPTLRLGLSMLLLLAALLASALAAGALLRLLPVGSPSVLYVATHEGLYVARGDYLEPQILRDDGAYFVPSVSADGRYVATTYLGLEDLTELRILTAEGVFIGRVLGGADGPAWSPVAHELAVSDHITGELLLVAPDGTQVSSFSPPEGVRFGRPSWSPDGARLAVGVSSAAGQGLWLVGRSGQPLEQLIDVPGGGLIAFSWSPSGRHIAFATMQSGSESGTVWISAPDANQRLEVGSMSSRSWLLDWSPDGDRLVFASLVDGQSELFSVRADGSDRRRLTTDPAEDVNPSWSPDGRTIAFERALYGANGTVVQGTWVMNADGSDQRQVIGDWVGTGWGVDPEEPAEVEPLTGVFMAGTEMASGRQGHTATAALGSVLVAGGVDGEPSTSLEWAQSFTGEGQPAGEMLEARRDHSATRLPDGRILIVGGRGPAGEHDWLATAELIDPSARESSPAGALREARAEHSATLLPDGRVLIAGGFGAAGDVPIAGLATAELWDPETESFSPAGSLAMPLLPHTATSLGDGRVLVFSVGTTHIWELGSLRFREIQSPLETRQGHTATLLQNGRVLIVGGSAGIGALASGELFDPLTETFRPAASLNEARWSHSATLLVDGRVLIAGGDTGGPRARPLASAEIWDPATEIFVVTGSLTQPRTRHSAVLLWSEELSWERRVVIVGGLGSDWETLAQGELFYPFAPPSSTP